MKNLTPKQYVFLFAYPLGHMAAIAFCFLIFDLFNAWDSAALDVLFMAAMLLIAPILAFPRNLQEINIILSGWHPLLAFLVIYAGILTCYAVPVLLIYKKSKNR